MTLPPSAADDAAPAFALDQQLLRQRFGRAAARYDEADLLAREIASRMDERLDYIRLQPQRVLDLGCGSGADLEPLTRRYPAAQIIGADFALPMLAASARRTAGSGTRTGLLQRLLGKSETRPPLVAASARQLPFAYGSFDLLWSNLMLATIDEPLPVLVEMQRCLRVGGLLMFSTFGPDTLRELRSVLPARAGERVHRFIDMHDLGDALVQAGFADAVMDMQMLTLTYPSFDQLMADLRASGASNAALSRPRGLSGRRGWEQARQAYEALRTEGRLPASFEIIQGHAWKAEPKTVADGRSIVRFQPRSSVR